MRITWPFDRHQRWRDDVDAFVDGELSGERSVRFGTHVAGCVACAALVAERSEVKRLTMALPELRARRSFQLTPGMLVDATGVTRSGGSPRFARLAQVTAGVAAIAFAAVLVADLSSDGDSGGSTRQASSDGAGAAPLSAADDLAATPGARNSDSESASSATSSQPPDVDGGVGAAGNPQTTPAPAVVDSAYGGSPTVKALTEDATNKGLSDQGAGTPAERGDSVTDDEDDRVRARVSLTAEIILAALAVGAALTWVTIRGRGTRA